MKMITFNAKPRVIQYHSKTNQKVYAITVPKKLIDDRVVNPENKYKFTFYKDEEKVIHFANNIIKGNSWRTTIPVMYVRDEHIEPRTTYRVSMEEVD